MLKLSTKGRYGLRAMIDLATYHDTGPVMMSDIADRQGVSRKYLHALLTALKRAGLVESFRGARGGYRLARPPGDIRVSEVFEALEGRIAIVDCLEGPDICSRAPNCSSRGMWEEISLSIADTMQKKSLADLVRSGEKGK